LHCVLTTPCAARCAGISRVKDPAKSYLNATNDTGTPMYMAPEQFNGTRVDEKARSPLADPSQSQLML